MAKSSLRFASGPVMTATLHTKRLTLRPLREDDLVELASTINNFRVLHTTARPPWPYTLDDANGFFRSFDHSFGSRRFVIAPRIGPPQILGVIGLDAQRPRSVAEIGYWLAEAVWSRGYGFEAAHAVTNHAFTVDGHARLVASFRHGNEGSRRILDRLGFRIVGHAMSFSRAAGASIPIARLELTQSEWLRR